MYKIMAENILVVKMHVCLNTKHSPVSTSHHPTIAIRSVIYNLVEIRIKLYSDAVFK